MIILSLTIIPGCSNNINGSKILSKDGVKGHSIAIINITFFDSDNRIKSPVAMLSQGEEIEGSYIQEFEDIIMASKGFALEDQDRFSPASDSSHFIEVIFENDYKLDFYYSSDHDWIIWSTIEEDGQKIQGYHFLNSTLSMAELLTNIEPLAVLQ